ncbi:MAG: bacterial Ig-like domain-containing protein [Clostridia bacterium]|nr:bacterial Ig-like domain-containing protein [Clostridia bacterium]
MTRRFKSFILFTCIIAMLTLCITPVLADEEIQREIISFEIMKGVSSKTNYVEGEFFDISGFAAKLTYNDGSTDWVFEHDLTYRETGPLTVNNKYITFDYAGFACMYPITVISNQIIPVKNIIGIEFSSTKTEFLALETIDPSIFSAGVIYSDGTTEQLDLAQCTIFPSITDPVTSNTTMYTLTYSDGYTTYSDTIGVNVAPILSIELSGTENAKLYESTAFAPPVGLTVTAYYDEARTVSRVVDNYTVSSNSVLVTPNDQGKTQITITVDALTAEMELEVLPIVNYKITTPKAAFYYGDLFSTTSFGVTAYYSDGTTYDVSDQVVWNAPEMIVAGSKVTASHNGFDLKDFIPFTLPEGTLSIITEPAKTHYEIGEIFDTTGLSVGINYSDGERKLLNPGEYELIVTSPLTSADKNVTVSYFGASTNISISVGDEAYIVSIQLIGIPDVMTYYEGSLLNTSGINIEAYMSDGTKVIINPKTLTFTPALGTPLTTDITQVVISANDGTDKYCECSFPITVMDKLPTGLIATSKPYKLEYAEGEIFNPDGLALSLFFNDGSSIVPSSYTFSPELGETIILHSNATEKCIIYAVYEYEGVEYTYPIEITVTPAEIENLFIVRNPVKTVYEIGEEFIPMGIEIMVIYKDRTLMSQVIPEGYYTYSPTVITAETKEIVFSFRGLTVSLPITVNGGVTSEDTTKPIDPPDTTTPPVSEDITTTPPEATTEDITTEPGETTVEDPITTEPEDPTDPIETTASPEDENTTEGESTTGDSSGGGKGNSSLLYLWIIIIVIIVAALIALIIYYKKNFT